MGLISNNAGMVEKSPWSLMLFVHCTLLAALGVCESVGAATPLPSPTPVRSSYWRERVSLFKTILHRADVVMIGDSLTDGAEWSELFPG